MDKITTEQRSRNMSAIKSKGNRTTEIEFIKLLRENKITGWRRHKKGAYGSPDFLFAKQKLVIFIDGCFWHGCKKHCKMPKTNLDYWKNKIQRNKMRDRLVNKYYKNKQWTILRVWEHNVKNKNKILKEILVKFKYENL